MLLRKLLATIWVVQPQVPLPELPEGEFSFLKDKDVPRSEIREVAPGVFDDMHDTVYITAGELDNPDDRALAAMMDLMQKKQAWQGKNPSARIVSISVVHGPGPGPHNYTEPVGLLIYYVPNV